MVRWQTAPYGVFDFCRSGCPHPDTYSNYLDILFLFKVLYSMALKRKKHLYGCNKCRGEDTPTYTAFSRTPNASKTLTIVSNFGLVPAWNVL